MMADTDSKAVLRVQAGGSLNGELRAASDKSISHRAVLLGGLGDGTSHIRHLLDGEDVLATMAAMEQLGARVERLGAGEVRIHGVGQAGLEPPAGDLDMGNSGTAMRLLAGVLAAQPFPSRLIGDESLSRRPMGRILTPLNRMGARIQSQSERPPLDFRPTRPLIGIDYDSPVASAQVKSCLMLAGLCAGVPVLVREPSPSRDHTERMLCAMGVRVTCEPGWARVDPGPWLTGRDLDVPADISSAAFFMVGACIAPGSRVLLRDVCMNPTRIGVFEVLEAMGARCQRLNPRTLGNEPVADLIIETSELQGIDIPPEWVARTIDEFPALFVAAACASGTTRIRGAAELRVKESDRIGVMVRALRKLGIEVDEHEDGADIHGGSIRGGQVDAAGDHRCAMSLAIAALAAQGAIEVADTRNIATSYPAFAAHASSLGLRIEGVQA